MKSQGRCIVCSTDFTYRTVSNQSVDYEIFGGDICNECSRRGLKYFLGDFKKQVHEEEWRAVATLARKIREKSSLEGDWWTRESPLFRALKVKRIKLEIER